VRYSRYFATSFVLDAPATLSDAEISIAQQPPDAVIVLGEAPAAVSRFISNVREYSKVPMVVVTDQAEFAARLLELGADDVVIAPARINELTARIKALIRRAVGTFSSNAAMTLTPGVYLHVRRRRLLIGERDLPLTNSEFRFMLALAREPGSIVTTREIAEAVWGTSYFANGDALRALIKRLRSKLGEARGIVCAEPGHGYYISDIQIQVDVS